MDNNFHSVFMKQIQSKWKCRYSSYLLYMIYGKFNLILKNSVKNIKTIRIIFLLLEHSAKFYTIIYQKKKHKCKLIMKIMKLH